MKKKSVFKKIIDYTLNILMVICTIFLLISIYNFIQVKVLKNDYSNFFGYTLFEVETGSMKPTIKPGDWIILKTSKDVKVNDIITYKQGKNFITHRVIETYRNSYVTKGDNNNSKDSPIAQKQVVGKVIKILPKFGILKKTIFNPIVIIFSLITLVILNLYLKMGKKEDSKLSKLFAKFKKVENETKKTTIDNQLDNFEDDPEEDDLSKTKLYRIISVNDDDYQTEDLDAEQIEELVKVANEEDDQPDEMSKTSMFRIIHVEDDDDDEEYIPEEEPETTEPEVEAKPIKKKDIKLNAIEIETKTVDKKITKDYINEKINSKKAKNIIDKTFFIKKIIYDEILNILLRDGYVYICKSVLRNDFMEKYFELRYFGLEEERSNTTSLLKDYRDELLKKYVRDEQKTNIVNAYAQAFLFINKLETRKNFNIEEELTKMYGYDKYVTHNMAVNINNVLNFATDALINILNKFDTNAFEVKYNKFANTTNWYGAYLKHNINFSKVYSDYIVNKTYNEGVISEDKLAVLINIVLCQMASDILKRDYNTKYYIYIPEPLYGKDKKLDKIASLFDNDYAKNHLIIASTFANIINNKDDLLRLKKKGYNFAIIFDQEREIKEKELGYVYMAESYFIDKNYDLKVAKKQLPKDIINIAIVDDTNKKLGNYGGEL